MDQRFQCPICPTSYGRRDCLLRHISDVHDDPKTFQCPACPNSYNRNEYLTSHVIWAHGGVWLHAFAVCGRLSADLRHIRAEDIECPVCHAKLKTQGAFVRHTNKHHPAKELLHLKREPTVKPGGADCPSPPSKRVKKAPASAEGIAAIKSEDDDVADSPVFDLRTTVKFKTSSGRVRIVEDQSASMSYGDFRKLFGIPLDTPKRIEFMKSDDQWIVAVDDNMKLPLVDGCIVAETCTDF